MLRRGVQLRPEDFQHEASGAVRLTIPAKRSLYPSARNRVRHRLDTHRQRTPRQPQRPTLAASDRLLPRLRR